jgi:hypothetical protein
VTADCARRRAFDADDLGRFFIEPANAGDVDGVVALYEPTAAVASPRPADRHHAMFGVT